MPSRQWNRRNWLSSMPSTGAWRRKKPSKRKEHAMKTTPMVVLAGLAMTVPATSHAQVAGTTLLAVSVAELRDVTLGWSAKRQILGQPVYNDKNERVGSVD